MNPNPFNNISVPTINYALSGSTSVPITQGTFQSYESVTTQNFSNLGGAFYPGSPIGYNFVSNHVYLQLNLGKARNLYNPAFSEAPNGFWSADGYSGIQVKGTILKPNNDPAGNLKHTIAFEHFGTIHYPAGWGESGDIDTLASNLYSEFVLKSQTWSELDHQVSSNIGAIPNYGLETAYNWGNTPGLQYVYNGANGGQGGDLSQQNSVFPMYLTWPEYPDYDGSVYLNCGINFYSDIESEVQGFIVKGTYLLL